MDQTESRNIAQNMMSVHGLRAQAVVRERMTEARAQGDAAGMERWQTVEAMIAELRRTGHATLARA